MNIGSRSALFFDLQNKGFRGWQLPKITPIWAKNFQNLHIWAGTVKFSLIQSMIFRLIILTYITKTIIQNILAIQSIALIPDSVIPEFAHIPDWGFGSPEKVGSMFCTCYSVICYSVIPDFLCTGTQNLSPIQSGKRAIDCSTYILQVNITLAQLTGLTHAYANKALIPEISFDITPIVYWLSYWKFKKSPVIPLLEPLPAEVNQTNS